MPARQLSPFPLEESTYKLLVKMMIIRPNRPKHKRPHKPKRIDRPVDPLATERMSDLEEATKHAASQGIELRQRRQPGRTNNLDSLAIEFRLGKLIVGIWFPVSGIVHVGGKKLLAVSTMEALEGVTKLILKI